MTPLSLIVIFCFGLGMLNVFGQTSQKDTSIAPVIVSFGKKFKSTINCIDTMTMEDIQKIDSLSITDLKGKETDYKIIGFTITATVNKLVIDENSSTNKLTIKQKDLINLLHNKNKIYLENVRVIKDGVIKMANSIIVVIKEK